MPVDAPSMQGGGDQWDVVTTITELEKLQAQIHRVIEHTLERMGRPCGIAIDGSELVEHPLGIVVSAVQEALKACHAKYGRDMLKEAHLMHGAMTVTDDVDGKGRA